VTIEPQIVQTPDMSACCDSHITGQFGRALLKAVATSPQGIAQELDAPAAICRHFQAKPQSFRGGCPRFMPVLPIWAMNHHPSRE
jgi:hypothetical protein